MKDLTIDDVHNTQRPECGAHVSGYESNRGMKEKVTPVEMWPGGPIWNDPGKQVIMEPAGPWVTTLDPCGHEVGKVIRTEAARAQMRQNP